MSIKISALPAITTLDPSDILIANKSGVTSKILFSSLQTVLAFQPLNGNLSVLAGVTPSALGLNLLAALAPDTTSYPLVSHFGIMSFKTTTQVVADLRTNGGGVDQSTAQLLSGKIINGVTLSAGIASTPDDTVTSIDAPSDTYPLKLIKVGYTGGALNFRFTKSTDVTFPSSGVLAVVSRLVPTSDDTKASAATVNLDTTDGSQVDVTGTTTITAVTLAANVEKIVRFTGVLTLTNSANLVLPGAQDIVTSAGDYAVFKGAGGSVVNLIEYKKAGVNIRYGGDFSTGGSFKTLGTFLTSGPFATDSFVANAPVTISGTLDIDGDLSLNGAFRWDVNISAISNTTIPAGTHTLLARDSYATTVTAAGTTTLTVSSQYQQFFTGSTTQTVTLPVANTLPLGFTFRIVNLSSGNVTVQSSGANSVVVLSANTSAILTCILASGTSAASWSAI